MANWLLTGVSIFISLGIAFVVLAFEIKDGLVADGLRIVSFICFIVGIILWGMAHHYIRQEERDKNNISRDILGELRGIKHELMEARNGKTKDNH
jgi:hypothetical protein